MSLELNQWGLPPLIVAWFRKKGVTRLFPWQLECLQKRDVLDGGNLVYSAPTSAGKSLVAEFLLIKKVLEYGKKALFIEPFVATTKEKAVYLKSMFATTKARVGTFAGTYYTPGGITAVSIAVCTIEKANNIINKLIAESQLKDLGLIVVDEIHHVGDDRRGYLIELILTKVMYYNSKQDKRNKIQIVGLSATVPNLETLAVWLNASLYSTQYRPVPLIEKIKLANKIYNIKDYLRNPKIEPVEIVDPAKYSIKKDFDDLFYLCIDTLSNGHSVLVFCESKRECEQLSTGLAEQIKISGGQMDKVNKTPTELSQRLRNSLSADKIKEVLSKLKKCPAGPDKELVKALFFGAAFHHAGLTTEEREIIEDGFKSGAIKALMATSTLSSGVNLPARRVIIRSPTMISSTSVVFTKEMLNPITYKQMIGRAGRKNIDTYGESILICNPDNQAIALKLVRTALSDIKSALGERMMAAKDLGGEPGGLKRAILEVVANSTADTRKLINQYLRSSLWLLCATPAEENQFMDMVTDTLRYLVDNKFIEELKPEVYRATRLGIAVLSAGLNPDDSLDLVKDLIKAQGGFLLNNDLHIIYQITPYDIARAIDLNDWLHYSNVWNGLNVNYQIVGEKVGIEESTIIRKCQGYLRSMSDKDARVYKRFWVALAINDLISEVPLPTICVKYRMTKAVVQQVQRQVAQFAGVISIFCQELGYDNIAALVKPLESRINFSCQRDLLELIKLNLNRATARTLFKAGYKTIISLAKADKLDIEFVIRQTKPFRKEQSFSENADIPSIWVPELALNLTTLDYASHIVDSAKAYFEMEYDLELSSLISKSASTSIRNPNSNLNTDTITSTTTITKSRLDTIASTSEMPEANKEVPNFVVYYMDCGDTGKLADFIKQWLIRSSVSVAFKVITRVRESVGRSRLMNNNLQAQLSTQTADGNNNDQLTTRNGARSRTRSRSRSRSRSSSNSRLSFRRGGSGGPHDDSEPITNTQKQIRNGLKSRIQIDNYETILTRMFVCFDQEMEVFVLDSKRALEYVRDNLASQLKESRRTTKLKLFTKDMVSTYKIMNAVLNMDRTLLDSYFEWNGFDVAWWIVQDCPNRGYNNRNSSLSLITKTPWAEQYHHFLYNKTGRNRAHLESRADRNGTKIRFEDVVKAGKTAILEPLMEELIESMDDKKQLGSYKQAEIISRLAISEMMIHGMGVDMRAIRDELVLYDDLAQELEDIAQRHYAKSSISLNSIRDVARVIYDDLALGHHLLEHRTKADIANRPTNAEILNILAQHHPFPKLVQDFRKLGKARDALQSVSTHTRYDSDLQMYRVFGQCDFWQLTGRVSMFDPDLFLINRNFTITIPKHAHRVQEYVECGPRRCFIPNSNWVMVSADYSQLELRLLAHFSNDSNLSEILNRSGSSTIHQATSSNDQPAVVNTDSNYDVFKLIGSKIYKKPLDHIDEQMRQRTKQICYGMIYGMGNTSLANALGVQIEEAQRFREDFFEAFPRLGIFMDEVLDECERSGYVESILGRRRQILDIEKEDNSSARAKAERVAINSRIQSSASDIIKLAIAAVNEKILEHYEQSARMVLEMHDELIFEVEPMKVDEFLIMLKSTMESLPLINLRVKLLVNLKKGPNWAKMDKN